MTYTVWVNATDPTGSGLYTRRWYTVSRVPRRCSLTSRGCVLVIPSSPARAYGLLVAAIRDPDPVVFIEPKRIYRAVREHVEDNGEALPLDTCFVLREGVDATVVTWGATVIDCLTAADALAEEGVSVEVTDVATLSLLDTETVLASVEKTRCIIVHEAARTCGFGAEIAACVAEEALSSLVAPIERVAGYDAVMPLSRLEAHYLPGADRVAGAVRAAMEHR